LVEDVRSPDRRTQLEAIRDTLAAHLAQAEPREAAALAKQLQAVLRELSELPAVKESNPLDELNARRAARLAGAANPEPAKRGSRKRGSRSG